MRLCIVNNTSLLEKIENVPFLNREGDYIKKLLEKSNIDISNVSFSYLTEDLETRLQSADFGVIISLGAIPTGKLLKLKKTFKLDEYVGKCYPFYKQTLIPWYSASHLLIRGKKLEAETLKLFTQVKDML